MLQAPQLCLSRWAVVTALRSCRAVRPLQLLHRNRIPVFNFVSLGTSTGFLPKKMKSEHLFLQQTRDEFGVRAQRLPSRHFRNNFRMYQETPPCPKHGDVLQKVLLLRGDMMADILYKFAFNKRTMRVLS